MLSLILLTLIAQQDAPKPILAPVPGYRHSVGDVVCVYSRSQSTGKLIPIIAAYSYSDMDEFAVFALAGDEKGMLGMADGKRGTILEPGVKLRILEVLSIYQSSFKAGFATLRCRVENPGTKEDGKEVYVMQSQATLCRLVPAATKAKRRR